MYGEYVTLQLGDDIECTVWVNCNPNTSESEKQLLAMNKLVNRIPQKKKGLAGLSDALLIINNYEYSRGYGSRYEAEKRINEMFEK